MDLLILGESLNDPAYRGTDRTRPYYVDSLPAAHPANEAFLWYVNNQDEYGGSGLVHDLEKSYALIAEYAKLEPPQKFELIEMTRGDARPESTGELLGFDVTELYCHSILADGLHLDPERHKRAIELDEGYRSVAPLVRLFKGHFSARLNEHALFPDKPTADFCRDCAAALIQFDADLFDVPRESLLVVGLYKVAPR